MWWAVPYAGVKWTKRRKKSGELGNHVSPSCSLPFCAVQSPSWPFTLSLQLSPTVSTAGRLLNSQSGLLGKLGCLGKVEPGPLSYVWMIHNAPLLLYIFFVARSPVFAWTTFNVKNTYNFESECYHPGLPIFSSNFSRRMKNWSWSESTYGTQKFDY